MYNGGKGGQEVCCLKCRVIYGRIFYGREVGIMNMLDKKSLARAVVLSLLTTGVVGGYGCNLGYAEDIEYKNKEFSLVDSEYSGNITINTDKYTNGTDMPQGANDGALIGFIAKDGESHKIEGSIINVTMQQKVDENGNFEQMFGGNSQFINAQGLDVRNKSNVVIANSALNIIVKAQNIDRDGNFTNNGIFVTDGSTLDIINSDVKVDVRNREQNELSSGHEKNDALSGKPKGWFGKSGELYVNYNSDDPSKHTVQIDGGIDGKVYLKLANKDSYWYGAISGYKGYTFVELSNGAEWVPTDDNEQDEKNVYNEKIESIANLTLNNGGIVNLSTENYKSINEIDDIKRDVGTNHQVNIDNLKGSGGIFKLDLAYHGAENDNNVGSYINGTDSDFVVINGGDGGEHTIQFADNDKNIGAMDIGNKLYFAQVKDGAATFGDGETITAANSNDLYDKLFKVDSESTQTDETGYNDWFITCTGEKENPNAVTPIHSYNAGFALWRDDDTLLKRLGELRYTNDEGGVWARIIGKKLEMDGAYGFDSNANTVQVGYDRKDVQEDGSGTWRRGIALGYTEADTSFGSGDGENNYADLSLYATNIRKHDHYLDLVARVGNIDSEYDTIYGDHGDFDNWAASISAEYGRKKKMNEDNWFIEPQVQLTYSYMWGDDFTTDKGISVSQENADSLVGRLGFIISREFESERKYPNRIYAKASVLHDFLGESGVAMYQDGKSFYDGVDFGDTWYVVGIGANADMGNNCTFYVDAERAFKADVEMPYRLEAGFRWEF